MLVSATEREIVFNKMILVECVKKGLGLMLCAAHSVQREYMGDT